MVQQMEQSLQLSLSNFRLKSSPGFTWVLSLGSLLVLWDVEQQWLPPTLPDSTGSWEELLKPGGQGQTILENEVREDVTG